MSDKFVALSHLDHPKKRGEVIVRQRMLFLLAGCLLLAGVFVGRAADQAPLDYWAYTAMTELQAAGLLQEYPAEWIEAGHLLTRYELAFYIRAAILRYSQRETANALAPPAMTAQVELALGKLVAEFAPELRMLGVNVEPWSDEIERRTFVDLDNLLTVISHRMEIPPLENRPGTDGKGGQVSAETNVKYQVDFTGANKPVQAGSMSIPSIDFNARANNLISLAGELLGIEWTLGLGSESSRQETSIPLHIGSFTITEENIGMQGGFGLRVGDRLGLGLDALWGLDLDQTRIVLDSLLLGVNTEVELNRRLGLFGGLLLDYQRGISETGQFDSQASAGLRVLLGEELYLIAEYSLANPFSGTLPRWQSAAVGMGLGDIGLLLLGLRTLSFKDLTGLELTGEFIYRF